MRKVIAVIATLALAFALTGCVTQVTKENSKSMSATADAGVSASASASASSASASASASSSAQSSSSAAVNWTAANTDDAAAKGAGLDKFGVPARTVIADFVFVNPTFAYTQNVAQATYEVAGSAKLVVRKAEGAHSVGVTDRDKASFAQSWQNTYEGFDVTSAGDTQGAATICLWNDATLEYGVTIEGLGGDKVTMSAEDVDDIVKAVKSAEAIQTTPEQQQTAADTSSKSPAFDPKQAVFNNGLGEYVSHYYVKGDDGNDYWALVTHAADGSEHTTIVDAQGNVIKNQPAWANGASGTDMTKFDATAYVANNGLGELLGSYITMVDGQNCWALDVRGSDGAERVVYVDANGNIVAEQLLSELGNVVDQNFDPEAAALNNGLGQFVTAYTVELPDTYCWAIVTLDTEGNQVTTYVDIYGNVIPEQDEFANLSASENATSSTSAIDPEAVAAQYGLGELNTYYVVQGADGASYWALVTTGADGNQATTYLDMYGNVIQGGDVEVGTIADTDASYNAYANTADQGQQQATN